jgi:hypothetical protein
MSAPLSSRNPMVTRTMLQDFRRNQSKTGGVDFRWGYPNPHGVPHRDLKNGSVNSRPITRLSYHDIGDYAAGLSKESKQN